MIQQHHATVIRVAVTSNFDASQLVVSADQSLIKTPRFGIDDARSLLARAYQRPTQGAQQQLIVITDFITHEAQNALLKVLEEPPESTFFLFVLPLDFPILPTLASRFYFDSEYDSTDASLEKQCFEEFLQKSYTDRMVAIELSVKSEDQVWQRSIKHGLTTFIVNLPPTDPSFIVLLYVVRNLLTRGASNKMLLEQAALSLPVS